MTTSERGEEEGGDRDRDSRALAGATQRRRPHDACTTLTRNGCMLRLSPTVFSEAFCTLYIEKIPFSIAPAAFSKWYSKIENATGFLYIQRFSLLFSIFSLRFKH
jgi:hypothetical protein